MEAADLRAARFPVVFQGNRAVNRGGQRAGNTEDPRWCAGSMEAPLR